MCAWAVDALEASPRIGAVALVVSPGRVSAARRLIAAAGWRKVRVAESLAEAENPVILDMLLGEGLLQILEELAPGIPKAVVLHEGTRPLLEPALLDALFAAWDGEQVVAAASPVKETLKVVDDDRLVRQTLPRERLWQVGTPLLLPGPLLRRIVLDEEIVEPEFAMPTTGIVAMIARAPDVRLRLVPAGHDDIVVRRRADLRVAEGMLAAERAR